MAPVIIQHKLNLISFMGLDNLTKQRFYQLPFSSHWNSFLWRFSTFLYKPHCTLICQIKNKSDSALLLFSYEIRNTIQLWNTIQFWNTIKMSLATQKCLVYTNLIFWGEVNDVREDDGVIRKGNEDTRLRFLVFLKQ